MRGNTLAVSSEIREADQAARVALLNKITEAAAEAEHVSVLVDLAQAYNLVTQTAAPRDPSRAYSA